MYITAEVHIKKENPWVSEFKVLPHVICMQLGWELIEAQTFSIPPLLHF